MKIKVAGLDPSMANFGMAFMTLDLSSYELELDDLLLIGTEKRANKAVRQNSDDLRRATETRIAYHKALTAHNVQFAFSEVPSGGQSARAVYSFGIVVGLLASCPVPVIQVQPFETKLATVGTKTASKQEMIEFATETYPTGPWLRKKFKGELRILNDNEHLADAVAVAHAGIKTDQFQQVRAMLMATMVASAAA